MARLRTDLGDAMMNDGPVSRIVVVGGGSAGWLSACLVAARSAAMVARPLQVTLVESPDVPTIGVGEGTWPTMRQTLQRIGIGENEFLVACDASFKQGSRFQGWHTGAPGDHYHHPFTPPPADASPRELVEAWQVVGAHVPFAHVVSEQPRTCTLNLAPRRRDMPDYAGALNYAYHFDAGKFAGLLAEHGRSRLGVRHIRDHVVQVERDEKGNIAAVVLRDEGRLEGDLFLDCTGNSARLIGQELNVPFRSRQPELFNDRALAVQVPVEPGSPIASETVATAHQTGWFWDIGLPTRRGIGCVYSSDFLSDDEAAELLSRYVREQLPSVAAEQLAPRRLAFQSGHRERFWEGNCLAIGLSAGFLEPLEASAIVLIELSLDALLENFPAQSADMPLCARRFNDLFAYRWQRIVEFLKLHYVLSARQEPYWRAHREERSVPDRLTELLQLWRHRPPSRFDLQQIDEIFPAASYQYVLYGMGFPPPSAQQRDPRTPLLLQKVEQRGRTLASSLPTNRAYLDALRSAGVFSVNLETVN